MDQQPAAARARTGDEVYPDASPRQLRSSGPGQHSLWCNRIGWGRWCRSSTGHGRGRLPLQGRQPRRPQRMGTCERRSEPARLGRLSQTLLRRPARSQAAGEPPKATSWSAGCPTAATCAAMPSITSGQAWTNCAVTTGRKPSCSTRAIIYTPRCRDMAACRISESAALTV
jgi:hypothetical protein